MITLPKSCESARHFIDGEFFFKMATLGGNAVICADGRMHGWLHDYVLDKPGYWLFEHGHLCAIDGELAKYGKRLWQTHHMFLPHMELTAITPGMPVRWFEQGDIGQFYGDMRFSNARSTTFSPERPDVLAVAAYEAGRIIGMAGCSADTEDLWQVGIDVLADCRGRGVGTYLVKLLKNEILIRGKIPYYGTSLSNLGSWRVALSSGFYPAWIEVATVEE